MLHSKVLLSVSVTMTNGEWQERPYDRCFNNWRLDDTKWGISCSSTGNQNKPDFDFFIFSTRTINVYIIYFSCCQFLETGLVNFKDGLRKLVHSRQKERKIEWVTIARKITYTSELVRLSNIYLCIHSIISWSSIVSCFLHATRYV